eukprot:1178206-Prorocentrum_minimum.AAC.1
MASSAELPSGRGEAEGGQDPDAAVGVQGGIAPGHRVSGHHGGGRALPDAEGARHRKARVGLRADAHRQAGHLGEERPALQVIRRHSLASWIPCRGTTRAASDMQVTCK